MTVKQAYTVYQTPKNLQKHMLSTAALASIFLEHWTGRQVDTEAIIKACTIHDIAKPMNFDLAKQAQYGLSKDEIEALEKLQHHIKTAFGNNEHQATLGIAREIGCSLSIIKYIDNLEWKYIPQLLAVNDISSLIPIYCDMRIGPKGILPLEGRLRDIKERINGDDYAENVKNGNLLEHIVQENIGISVNSITNHQIEAQFHSLLDEELQQNTICPGCGGEKALFSSPSCQDLYYALSSYTLSLQDSDFIHQLIVDTYAAQHASIKQKPITTTFALVGLFLVNERGFTGKQVQQAHMILAGKSKVWPSFSVPKEKNWLTVRDVSQCPDEEKPAMIKEWSRSVWHVWEPEKKKVAALVKRYLEI